MSMTLSVLSLSQVSNVFDYRVVEVDSKLAQEYTLKYHYLHRRCSARVSYALYSNHIVVGVCIFAQPAGRSIQKSVAPGQPDSVIELARLWVCDLEPRNTESWFVSRCLKLLGARIVISYADTVQGHEGIVYRALNFNYAGWTDMHHRKAHKLYLVPSEVHARHMSIRHIKEKGLPYIETRRMPKARYWIVTGNKREKRDLREQVKWPSLCWKEHPVPFEHKQLRLN